MGMGSEFKEFAMRGNVVDMAVGIVIGGCFTVLGGLVLGATMTSTPRPFRFALSRVTSTTSVSMAKRRQTLSPPP